MIVNHAAKLRYMSGGHTNVPIVIRCMTGAGFGTGGQHSDFWEAWFSHVAGMKVVLPSNAEDAYGLMRSAIDDPDPVLFIEAMPNYWTPSTAPVAGTRIPLGKARVALEGTDVTIVTYSRMVNEALTAARTLAEAGISAEVVDLRTVQPWDEAAVLASVGKTGRLLVTHEAVTPFGVGAEIAAVVQEQLFGKLKAPIVRVGAAFTPVPFSKPLESAYLPDAAKIVEAATRIVKR